MKVFIWNKSASNVPLCLVAQLVKALYQFSVGQEFEPSKEHSLLSSFSNKMAGISNMFNIMKRQVYKKTSKVKLVLVFFSILKKKRNKSKIGSVY